MLREHGDLLAPIAAGGALGSLARWGLATALPHGDATFPWATFLTNVSGCLLLGVLMAFVLGPWSTVPFWGRYLRPFLGVGVLGGYTTFSTYELETYVLGGHALALAMLYVLASVVAGIGAAWLGLTLGRVAVLRASRGYSLARRERTSKLAARPRSGRLDSGSEVALDGIDPDLDPDTAPGPDGGEER